VTWAVKFWGGCFKRAAGTPESLASGGRSAGGQGLRCCARENPPRLSSELKRLAFHWPKPKTESGRVTAALRSTCFQEAVAGSTERARNRLPEIAADTHNSAADLITSSGRMGWPLFPNEAELRLGDTEHSPNLLAFATEPSSKLSYSTHSDAVKLAGLSSR